MSRLANKLSRLSSPATKRFGVREESGGGVLQQRLRRAMARSADALVGTDARVVDPMPLPGTVEDTPAGALRRLQRAWDSGHLYGDQRVDTGLRVSSRELACLGLDEQLRHVDISRVLYMDTETTGLAGGTGTLPFLVGLGWFELDASGSHRFVVEQLLVEGPGQEAPMLQRFSERLGRASALVSFNGKTFDWPLLRTRGVMNGMPLAEPVVHLDLLHCARRVFGRRLAQTKLTTLEREVLGYHREGDVDGSEIPALYFRYLRTGCARGLDQVIEHNAQDMVAMAALLGRMAELYRGEETAAAQDRVGVAHVAARAGDVTHAISEGSSSDDPEGLLLAARLAKRQGDFVREAELLRQALLRCKKGGVGGSDWAPQVHRRLSMHYEHHAKDFVRALEHARQLANLEDSEEAERRLVRVQSKCASVGAP